MMLTWQDFENTSKIVWLMKKIFSEDGRGHSMKKYWEGLSKIECVSGLSN